MFHIFTWQLTERIKQFLKINWKLLTPDWLIDNAALVQNQAVFQNAKYKRHDRADSQEREQDFPSTFLPSVTKE